MLAILSKYAYNERMKLKNHSSIIDSLGGTSEVARLCGVQPQAVSQWRTDGIPSSRLMYLRLLRPDVFDEAPSEKLAA